MKWMWSKTALQLVRIDIRIWLQSSLHLALYDENVPPFVTKAAVALYCRATLSWLDEKKKYNKTGDRFINLAEPPLEFIVKCLVYSSFQNWHFDPCSSPPTWRRESLQCRCRIIAYDLSYHTSNAPSTLNSLTNNCSVRFKNISFVITRITRLEMYWNVIREETNIGWIEQDMKHQGFIFDQTQKSRGYQTRLLLPLQTCR